MNWTDPSYHELSPTDTVDATKLGFGYPEFVHWKCKDEPYHGLFQVVKLWVDVPKINDPGGAYSGRLKELGRLQTRKKSRIVFGMKCLSCGYTNAMKFILHDDRIFTYAGRPRIKSEFERPPKSRTFRETWRSPNVQIPVIVNTEVKNASLSVDLDLSGYILTDKTKCELVEKCTNARQSLDVELIGPTPYGFSIKLPRSKLSSMKKWLQGVFERTDSLEPNPKYSEDYFAKLIEAHKN